MVCGTAGTILSQGLVEGHWDLWPFPLETG